METELPPVVPPVEIAPALLKMSPFAFKPHPFLPIITPAEMLEMSLRANGVETLTTALNLRARCIEAMETDPLNYGCELENWRDSDMLLAAITVLIIFGGNRASKSEYAGKRVVQAALKHPGSIILVMHKTDDSSKATVQKVIWKFLPAAVKVLNGRKDPAHIYKITYSPLGGFTEGKLGLPNRSEIHFPAYKQEPGIYEGWELGALDGPSIGAWADEDMPLPWLKMLQFRLASRSGKLIWTFTAVDGLTATMKDAVGKNARTLQSRFAELLPDRVNIPGLPIGHMPYIQEPAISDSRVIYFFSKENPFGRHYDNIKKICKGRPSEFVEVRAYGYARDTGKTAFPNFGAWNIIKVEDLPAIRTNYLICDPHGARPWANLWIGVAPGKPSNWYVYRDWPDLKRFSDWAVTAPTSDVFDGAMGPAQQNVLGYGPHEYKKLFLREETISPPIFAAGEVLIPERDPYRRRIVEHAMEQAGLAAQPMDLDALAELVRDLDLREVIHERLIDPRAGKAQNTTQKGGFCLIDLLRRAEIDEDTMRVTTPGMNFLPAPGLDIDEGVNAINALLYWDKDRPLEALTNAPRMSVAENCRQVIWALENWTGLDGQEGACKEWVDLLRYAATFGLRYIEPGGKVKTKGGGSY